MKKLILLLTINCLFPSCAYYETYILDILEKYEDSIRTHEYHIANLEEHCKIINTNISSLQALVNVLDNRDYIINISPVHKDDIEVGYSISFACNKAITIYCIRDKKHEEQIDTPQIGIQKDTDNIYYWTLNEEWLPDSDGNKIPINDIHGTHDITPRLKIKDNLWYISHDNCSTWQQLSQIIEGGEVNNIFKDIIIEQHYIKFIIDDKTSTVIQVPCYMSSEISEERELPGIVLTGNLNNGGGITQSNSSYYKVIDLSDVNKSTILHVESTSKSKYSSLWALHSEPYKNSLRSLLAKGCLTIEKQSDEIDLSLYPTASYLYVAVGAEGGTAKVTYQYRAPNAYDEVKNELISITNKPSISWIDDDFTGVDYLGNISKQYLTVHDWCIQNNIKCDFAIIPDAPLSDIAPKIEVAKRWEEENFHFLFHPVHSEGWYNYSADKPHDIEAVKKSIVTGLRRLNDYGLLCPLDILVWPGNSHTFHENIEVVKNYMDMAVSVTQGVNHSSDNNRYKLARISIERLNIDQTVSDIKSIIDKAIERGDWLIFYTHIHSIVIADKVTETGYTTANLFELLTYANDRIKIRPTESIWRERKILWEYCGK